jgi:arginase
LHVDIIAIPYDCGHARVRTGCGPDAFLAGGLVQRLESRGHSVAVQVLERSTLLGTEIGSAFDLNRQLAARVRAVTASGSFPLILTGNCISSVGALAGLDEEGLGVLWFDAHGDFNTPETSTTGYLDGMSLAIAAGQCWRTLAATIPGFRPLPTDRVTIVGGRDFDPGERERFEAAGGCLADPMAIGHDERQAIPAGRRERVRQLYVHLDLDVLDPAEGIANCFAAPEGLRRMQVTQFLERATQQIPISGAALSAYDPALDADRRVLEAGIEFVLTMLGSEPQIR